MRFNFFILSEYSAAVSAATTDDRVCKVQLHNITVHNIAMSPIVRRCGLRPLIYSAFSLPTRTCFTRRKDKTRVRPTNECDRIRERGVNRHRRATCRWRVRHRLYTVYLHFGDRNNVVTTTSLGIVVVLTTIIVVVIILLDIIIVVVMRA